jgi:hypothetical protein
MKFLSPIFLIALVSCSAPKHLQSPVLISEETSQSAPFNYDTISYTPYVMMSSPPVKQEEPQTKLEEAQNENQSIEKIIAKVLIQEQKEVTMGKLIYDIPDTMSLRVTYVIKVRINRDTTQTNIKQNINTKRQSVIKTTSSMQVELIDPNPSDSKKFDIVKNNSEVQMVEKDDYTEWSFSVTPIRSGKSVLNIVVSIIKGDLKKQIVYSDSVLVETDAIVVVNSFWEQHWQWIFSTIIIPISVWLWNKKKKKADSEGG